MTVSTPSKKTRESSDGLSTRILDAFARRAGGTGLRGVVMLEVARDLGISTKTLYRQFPSKEHLVGALMERWAAHLEAQDTEWRAAGDREPLAVMREWAAAYAQSMDRFSPAFWAELERDYRHAFGVYAGAVEHSRRRARRRLAPRLRPGVSPEFAHEMFDAIVRAASDPELCERLNLSRKSALVKGIDLWTQGALQAE